MERQKSSRQMKVRKNDSLLQVPIKSPSGASLITPQVCQVPLESDLLASYLENLHLQVTTPDG